MKTNLISKSETTQLLKIVSEKWKIDLPKVKNLKVYEIDDEIQLITGDEIKIKYLGSPSHTQAGYLNTGATALDA